MQAVDLYVVAAGLGSRMRILLPKALVAINDDQPCLTTTLRRIGHKFQTVFVVTNILATGEWSAYFESLEARDPDLAKQVVNLRIESGLGDGHAVLQGIEAAERTSGSTLSDDIVITWGDVFFADGAIVDELLSTKTVGSGLLPTVWEENPYVALLVNEEMQCLAAEFSKFGERHFAGYHDQSVFRFSRPKLRTSLHDLHRALWKRDRYICPGGELSLLYAFHHLYNIADPAYVYETNHPTLSFNTVEEVMEIQREFRGQDG